MISPNLDYVVPQFTRIGRDTETICHEKHSQVHLLRTNEVHLHRVLARLTQIHSGSGRVSHPIPVSSQLTLAIY